MKRSLLLAVIALVGLTVTGVVYAAWSQSIRVDGTVATGTFDIIWGEHLEIPDTPEGFKFQDESVAEVTWERDDDHTITCTVRNAFPGWYSQVTTEVINNGTIPAKLSLTYRGLTDNLNLSLLTLEGESVQDRHLAPEQQLPVVIKVSVPYDSTRGEDQTYTFKIVVTGTQWYQGEGGQ